jgi:putative OPT family oligopeptide transporter
MDLFQRPAATPAEVERGRPLPLSPEEVETFDEETWRVRAFRGDAVPQLTVRAVVMGSALGFALAFSNVYVGLKVGWMLPVALTACILSFSLWNAFLKVGVARTPMSILENNCMQSTASAAGMTTTSMVTTAAPALLLLTVSREHPAGLHMPWPILASWIVFTALLGVMLAIPMKRSMINRERLKFPSGFAAAVTLQSLYSEGAEALRKGRALLYAALVAGATPLLMDLPVRGGQPLLPGSSRIFDWIPARGLDPKTGSPLLPSDWTVVLDHKLLMIAGGALIGMRVCISMVLGALFLAFVAGPAGLAAGVVTAPGMAWLEIGLWIGGPMLLVSGLLSILLSWRTVLRGFRNLASGPADEREVPLHVFVIGTLIAGLGVVALSHVYFDTPWIVSILAIALTFMLSLAVCRAAGQTDIAPLGPMATLTQLLCGIVVPFNIIANVASPGTTTSAACASADLLTDLKSGHLLGASPRRQLAAQLLGIVPGTVAVVLAYYFLVPDARTLIGVGGAAPAFPAPSAQMWLATARLVTRGFGGLHPMAQQAILWGALIGAALTVIEHHAPRSRWLPSATGIGLGMVIPFQFPFSFLLGATIAWLWKRRRPEQSQKFLIPVASGVVAGESVIGVLVAILNNFFLGHR